MKLSKYWENIQFNLQFSFQRTWKYILSSLGENTVKVINSWYVQSLLFVLVFSSCVLLPIFTSDIYIFIFFILFPFLPKDWLRAAAAVTSSFLLSCQASSSACGPSPPAAPPLNSIEHNIGVLSIKTASPNRRCLGSKSKGNRSYDGQSPVLGSSQRALPPHQHAGNEHQVRRSGHHHVYNAVEENVHCLWKC